MFLKQQNLLVIGEANLDSALGGTLPSYANGGDCSLAKGTGYEFGKGGKTAVWQGCWDLFGKWDDWDHSLDVSLSYLGYLKSVYQLLGYSPMPGDEILGIYQSTHIFSSKWEGFFCMQTTSQAPHGTIALLPIQQVHLRPPSPPKEATDLGHIVITDTMAKHTNHCTTKAGLSWDLNGGKSCLARGMRFQVSKWSHFNEGKQWDRLGKGGEINLLITS